MTATRVLVAIVLFIVAGWVWTSAFTARSIVPVTPWAKPDTHAVNLTVPTSRGPACVVPSTPAGIR